MLKIFIFPYLKTIFVLFFNYRGSRNLHIILWKYVKCTIIYKFHSSLILWSTYLKILLKLPMHNKVPFLPQEIQGSFLSSKLKLKFLITFIVLKIHFKELFFYNPVTHSFRKISLILIIKNVSSSTTHKKSPSLRLSVFPSLFTRI